MFTGIIEEVGKVVNVIKETNSLKLDIEAPKTVKSINLGDSICVNGVCLTATYFDNRLFSADVSPETFNRTNLKYLKNGSLVNLEKSLTLSKPLGGHIVTGHVDAIGKIISIKKMFNFTEFIIEFPIELRKYIVEKGSIAINGISLTVNNIEGNKISLMIIPHTIEETNLKNTNIGEIVNIEVDIIGKYVENMLKFDNKDKKLNIDFLRKHGFA